MNFRRWNGSDIALDDVALAGDQLAVAVELKHAIARVALTELGFYGEVAVARDRKIQRILGRGYLTGTQIAEDR